MSTVLDGWYSGQVQRKHIMMNLRAENVAEHTWGVIHVLLSVWPDASSRLIIGAQYHDFGERATGDIPSPVRWASPEINTACEILEGDYICDNLPNHISDILLNLTHEEKLQIEFADRVEFCFSMYREMNMGNRFAYLPFHRSYDRAQEALKKLFDGDHPEYDNTTVICGQLEDLKTWMDKLNDTIS